MARSNLVLTRKVGQSIVVGDATVRITKINHARVSVAVQAPRDVSVMREELVNGSDQLPSPTRYASTDLLLAEITRREEYHQERLRILNLRRNSLLSMAKESGR